MEFNHYRIRNKIFLYIFFFPAVFTTSGQMKGQHHLPLKTCQLPLDFHRYHKHRASHRIHLWLPIYHSVFPATVHHNPYGGEVTERARGCHITDQQGKEKQQCRKNVLTRGFTFTDLNCWQELNCKKSTCKQQWLPILALPSWRGDAATHPKAQNS